MTSDIDAIEEKFDVIYCSNTIEHFDRPFQFLKKMMDKARKYVVILAPFRETERDFEHFFTFDYNNFPLRVGDFYLVFFREIDCAKMEERFWGGKQFLCVYAHMQWVSLEKVRLSYLTDSLDKETRALRSERERLLAEKQVLEKQIEQEREVRERVERKLDHEEKLLHQEISKNARLQGQINLLQERNNVLAQRVESLESYTKSLLQELENIKATTWWKVATWYWRMATRSVVLSFVHRVFRVWRDEGLRGVVTRIWSRVKYPRKRSVHQNPIPVEEAVRESRRGVYKYDVIFFSIIDWDFRFQRPQHFATRFARNGHRVFYLSVNVKKGGDYQIRKVADNVYEVKLPAEKDFLIYDIYSTADENDHSKMMLALEKLVDDCGVKECVMIVQLPNWRRFAEELKRSRRHFKLVYDCLDEFSEFKDLGEIVLNDEKLLVELSDMCITSSLKLFYKIKEHKKETYLVKNGVDFHHFFNPPQNELLKDFKKPIIGYYGAISEWFDTELLEKVVKAHKEASFVLIGHTFGSDVEKLKKYKNVYLLGEKPYSELPRYLYWFDVCLIPFKVTKLIESTDPVKFYEYISAGKPVVTTALPELRTLRRIAYVSETHEEFLQNVKKAISEDPRRFRKERITTAYRNNWDKRFSRLQEKIRQMYPKVSIIVVTHNNLNYTRLCLNSLFEKTAYPNFEVIVVDNASHDGTREYLYELSKQNGNVKVIFNNENKGFAGANNQGIKASTGDFIVFLNNDTVVTKGWLGGLIRYFDLVEDLGMVGPVTNSIGNEAKIDVDYTNLSEMEEFAERYTKANKGKWFPIDVLAFYCVAVKKHVIEKVGCLDEQFSIGFFEDDDFCLRVKKAGYRLICAEDVFIHHFGGATFKKLSDEEYNRIFEENKRRYERKWNIEWKPHKYRNGTAAI